MLTSHKDTNYHKIKSLGKMNLQTVVFTTDFFWRRKMPVTEKFHLAGFLLKLHETCRITWSASKKKKSGDKFVFTSLARVLRDASKDASRITRPSETHKKYLTRLCWSLTTYVEVTSPFLCCLRVNQTRETHSVAAIFRLFLHECLGKKW